MPTEDEVKALISMAGQQILQEVSRGVQPLQDALRGIQIDLAALRIATYQLAAVFASRYPDGQAMLKAWLESTVKLVDTIPLNDDKNEKIPPEIETQIRDEIRKKLQAVTLGEPK